jgi:cysteine sulfinate desulfinase/cysteine desulfurase-like protein
VSEKGKIYVDNAATTPIALEVVHAVPSLKDIYGNPLSLHFLGHEAKETV